MIRSLKYEYVVPKHLINVDLYLPVIQKSWHSVDRWWWWWSWPHLDRPRPIFAFEVIVEVGPRFVEEGRISWGASTAFGSTRSAQTESKKTSKNLKRRSLVYGNYIKRVDSSAHKKVE